MKKLLAINLIVSLFFFKRKVPIHSVEVMSNNTSICYGLGNAQIAHLRYDAENKTMVRLQLIEHQFSRIFLFL